MHIYLYVYIHKCMFKYINTCTPIGNALYGLQGMKSDSVEVCEMLSALVPKIYRYLFIYAYKFIHIIYLKYIGI
jgi:hypothetical protein